MNKSIIQLAIVLAAIFGIADAAQTSSAPATQQNNSQKPGAAPLPSSAPNSGKPTAPEATPTPKPSQKAPAKPTGLENQNKQAAPTPKPEQAQQILAEGDVAKACPNGCAAGLQVTIVNAKNESRQGTIAGVSDGVAVINLTAPADFNPSKVLILGQPVVNAAGVRSAAAAAVLSVRNPSTLVDHRVVLRGDFRGTQGCTGFISDAQQNPVNITVVAITARTADVKYTAANDFVPDTLTLECATGGTVVVPFTLFRGVRHVTTSFVSASLNDDFCGKPCKEVASAHVELTLVPADPDADATLLRLTNGRIWVELTAPPDYAPQALTVHNTTNAETVYAKRTLGPVVDSHQPFVTYTIMDTETEKRDFGKRIFQNYLAINIQVHNPTTQKIQLNKARIWFDCDYAEINYHDLTKNDPSFRLINGKPKKYLFGIDHTQRQFPHTLLQILGAFDAQTGKENVLFGGADLAASIFSSLTGVFDTTEYAVATNIFSGIAVPGFRKLIMNPDVTNQKRANLTAQALDSVVQVSSQGATSTLLFLPRKGILAWQDTNGQERQIPVVIDTIRDVHFEPEIVVDMPASQNQTNITAGMTEDQVKAILGEPTARKEEKDDVLYTYSSGPYETVTFKKDGTGVYRVSSFEERPTTEQLLVGKTTIADAEKLLGSSRVDIRNAVDGGKIWVNPPVVGADLQFGSDNVLKSKSYHSALSALQQMVGQTLDVIVKKAEDIALTDAVKKDIEAKYPKEFSNGVLKIPSPDLSGDTIVLHCDHTTDTKCKVTLIQ